MLESEFEFESESEATNNELARNLAEREEELRVRREMEKQELAKNPESEQYPLQSITARAKLITGALQWPTLPLNIKGELVTELVNMILSGELRPQTKVAAFKSLLQADVLNLKILQDLANMQAEPDVEAIDKQINALKGASITDVHDALSALNTEKELDVDAEDL
jgi:hypothetical protein